MNISRLSLHGLLAGMLVVPFLRTVEKTLEASPAMPAAFHEELLLNRPITAPAIDKMARLERLVVASYTVSPNEDVWSICHKYNIDQFTIRSSNDLEGQIVAPGTVLKIPNRKGTLYQVTKPETLQSITHGFTRGKTLGDAYDREVLLANGYPLPDLKDPTRTFAPGTQLFLPDAWKPTGLQPPFSLKYMTSGYGIRRHPVLGITRAHKGFDLARPFGSAVTVTREGTVTYADWMGGYGNMIEVKHVLKGGRVYFTRYGHLSKILVHVGQHVRMYQLIGRVGSTGISTGPHLHFEVRDANGEARNPGKTL